MTISRTEYEKAGARSWGTTANILAACFAGMAYGSRPHTRTDPLRGANPLDATLTSVVFPDPLGPINPVIAPRATSSDTSWTTGAMP
jgi:hypothetical protein